MDKNIKKQDLKRLKKSKPVPIVAHSMELMIPVVYVRKVKEFLKKEGIKLPLSQKKLKKLKTLAKKIK
jgi:hypothetical protein